MRVTFCWELLLDADERQEEILETIAKAASIGPRLKILCPQPEASIIERIDSERD